MLSHSRAGSDTGAVASPGVVCDAAGSWAATGASIADVAEAAFALARTAARRRDRLSQPSRLQWLCACACDPWQAVPALQSAE